MSTGIAARCFADPLVEGAATKLDMPESNSAPNHTMKSLAKKYDESKLSARVAILTGLVTFQVSDALPPGLPDQ